MNEFLRNALALASLAFATQAAAQITFYEREGFAGRSFTTEKRIGDFERYGFNDRASSVVVQRERWEVCEDARFDGRCVVLRPGQYPSLAAMGLNERVSSVRAVERDARVADNRYAPLPVADRGYAGPARVTFYEQEGFQGRSFSTAEQVRNFRRYGFNDRASSVVVAGDRWEACEDSRFSGRCVVLRPGRYASLAAMGLNERVSSVRAVSRDALVDERRYAPLPLADRGYEGPAQITFYEHEGFQGRSFSTGEQVGNIERHGFNDRASSALVVGDRWEVCSDAGFSGRCVVLRPGQYGSLAAMGLNDRVSSVRIVERRAQVEDNRYAPAPVTVHDYRRRHEERVFEAEVTSVRAVVGPSEQRCWVEREQVASGGTNIPGALVGAVIGGILGHQIGGGRGKDVATAGGAIAGGVLGANVGRDSGNTGYGQDVKRCESVPSQTPAYWDVTYHFRGQEHRIQMTSAPGRTISVNSQGEPRA